VTLSQPRERAVPVRRSRGANLEFFSFLARVEDRDEDLIAIASGGDASSANFDDGDLNYDQGVVSNALQVSGELAARWSIFGLYVRGLFY
jgi:hypothetical protein